MKETLGEYFSSNIFTNNEEFLEKVFYLMQEKNDLADEMKHLYVYDESNSYDGLDDSSIEDDVILFNTLYYAKNDLYKLLYRDNLTDTGLELIKKLTYLNKLFYLMELVNQNKMVSSIENLANVTSGKDLAQKFIISKEKMLEFDNIDPNYISPSDRMAKLKAIMDVIQIYKSIDEKYFSDDISNKLYYYFYDELQNGYEVKKNKIISPIETMINNSNLSHLSKKADKLDFELLNTVLEDNEKMVFGLNIDNKIYSDYLEIYNDVKNYVFYEAPVYNEELIRLRK